MTPDVQEEGRYLPLSARLTICLIAPFSGFAQVGLTPILPMMSDHFASTPNAEAIVRLMMSSLSLTMIAGALGAGALAAKVGERRLLCICVLGYILSGVAGAVANNLYLLLASRMLLGTATAAWGILLAALLTTRVAPRLQERWLGFYVVAGTFGLFPLLMAASELAQAHWRYVFLLHLLIALPVGALLLLARDEQATPGKSHPEGGPETGRSRLVPWSLSLFSVMCGAVGATPMIFIPFHLATIGEGAPDKIGLVVMAITLAGGASALSYGWLRSAFSMPQVFVAGLLLNGVGLITIATSTLLSSVLVGGAIAGLGFGVVAPNLFAAAAASAPPDRRAWTLGFVRAAFFCGPLLAQLMLEPISKSFGPASAIQLLGIVGFIGVIVSARINLARASSA